ncbi:hypothetical protein AWB71_06014 [Caballeronia peredens]|nr:hypothetical protein AWB71_06014 [Caballeronia peredens]
MPARFLNLISKSAFAKTDQTQLHDTVESLRTEHGFATTFDVTGVTDLFQPALDGTYKVYFMGRLNRASSKTEAPSETVTNPTWLDLWRIADRLIVRQESGHRTHLYVEDFQEDEEGNLRVCYGS